MKILVTLLAIFCSAIAETSLDQPPNDGRGFIMSTIAGKKENGVFLAVDAFLGKSPEGKEIFLKNFDAFLEADPAQLFVNETYKNTVIYTGRNYDLGDGTRPIPIYVTAEQRDREKAKLKEEEKEGKTKANAALALQNQQVKQRQFQLALYRQNPGIAQRKAIELYPDLGVAGSPLNAEFVARVKRYQMEKKEFFADPDWPIRLGKECSDDLKGKNAP